MTRQECNVNLESVVGLRGFGKAIPASGFARILVYNLFFKIELLMVSSGFPSWHSFGILGSRTIEVRYSVFHNLICCPVLF